MAAGLRSVRRQVAGALGARRVGHGARSKGAREMAERIEALADVEPTLLRLVLMTYAADQSPFPLAGLESYEHIAQRIAYLEEEYAAEGENLRPLEEALVELDGILQFRREVGVGARRPMPDCASSTLRPVLPARGPCSAPRCAAR